MLGYRAPAPAAVVPAPIDESDINTFNVAIFRPSAAPFASRDVLSDVLERLNAAIPGAVSYNRVYIGKDRIRKRIRPGNEWQAKIRLPRRISTRALAELFETLDLDGLDLQGGRVHFGITTVDGEYLPLGGGYADPNDAWVHALDELLLDVMRYRSRKEEKGDE